MDVVLEVSNLKKSFKKNGFSFKKTEILKDISFSLRSGRITGFLGANGAGKTTTIKCLLELIFKDSGQIRFFGEEGLTQSARRKIGFLPERPYFYEYLTGVEFLLFYGRLSTSLTRHELDQRIQSLLDRVGLAHAKNRPLRSYSKGMLQRVGIAQALVNQPQFVIFDEPMTGLDPDGRWEVNEIIKETASQGTSIFFSSHLLNDAEKICQDLVVLKKGELIFNGSTDSFLGQVQVKYLVEFKTPDGHKQIEVNDPVVLQTQIDQIRNSGFSILQVQKNKMSLEEAFVKVAYEESKI